MLTIQERLRALADRDEQAYKDTVKQLMTDMFGHYKDGYQPATETLPNPDDRLIDI